MFVPPTSITSVFIATPRRLRPDFLRWSFPHSFKNCRPMDGPGNKKNCVEGAGNLELRKNNHFANPSDRIGNRVTSYA